MKCNITEYVKSLCGEDIEALETIIYKRYKPFISFYKATRRKADEIDQLTYSCTSDTSIAISITLYPEYDPEEFSDEISSTIACDSYDHSIIVDGDRIIVTLTKC